SRSRAQLKLMRSTAISIRHLSRAGAGLRPPRLLPIQERLLGAAFGEDALPRSLRRITRAQERIRGLREATEREMRKADEGSELGDLVRQAYGRLASFLQEVAPDLARLREMRAFLRARPSIQPELPTLVVAGFPNVGKSSLVARLSTARPKVAEYPFTTVRLGAGHRDLGFTRLQVLDTPGVLDRAGRENASEKEANVAVRSASAVLFVLDPSERCGFSMEAQLELLRRWQSELPGVPMVVVETKADLTRSSSGRLAVSAETGEGIDALEAEIRRTFRDLALLATSGASESDFGPMPLDQARAPPPTAEKKAG
ncbi:MAG TPA: GTPase, partial [Thermoplasmata archaeon]|nr:GTPase [Thermoplasmata archaeon]